MAKPIFLIKVSNEILSSRLKEIRDELTKLLSDYHVLVIAIKINEPTFEVFNGEDLDPVTIEELKEKLNNEL
jgi:Holliday junction resolvasome RuvABC endonuclease subunit